MNHTAVVLLALALAVVIAVLAGCAAAVLARWDGATYATAITRAATAFAATLTLAVVTSGALALYLP
ncbi:hypothetical protein ACIQEY_11715 [Streptomyces parvus]|uniref:hypothetical protein n=1 Tax=Streptomyces parvus TaxID=66428 RepID=UPI00380E2E5E